VKKNLVLLGMMAVGKTTLGKIVAKKQELKFIDIDASIEKKNSMTIKEIFKKKGEKFFRMEEENEILKSLEKNNCVIALGGGAFMNKTVRENILKNAISIWLSVDIGDGSSCHVGYRSCFYRSIPLGTIDNAREIKMKFEEKEKKFDPDKVYKGQPSPTKV